MQQFQLLAGGDAEVAKMEQHPLGMGSILILTALPLDQVEMTPIFPSDEAPGTLTHPALLWSAPLRAAGVEDAPRCRPGGAPGSPTNLCARLGDEAFDGDSFPWGGEGRLPQALHEGVDHCHGDLAPLLHLVQDLGEKDVSWESPEDKGAVARATTGPEPARPYLGEEPKAAQAADDAENLGESDTTPGWLEECGKRI